MSFQSGVDKPLDASVSEELVALQVERELSPELFTSLVVEDGDDKADFDRGRDSHDLPTVLLVKALRRCPIHIWQPGLPF